MKLLGMPKASVIDVSVNNENIRFSAKDVKRGLSCFNWLVECKMGVAGPHDCDLMFLMPFAPSICFERVFLI